MTEELKKEIKEYLKDNLKFEIRSEASELRSTGYLELIVYIEDELIFCDTVQI